MTGEAALRAGAGLVRVLTHKDNITPLLTARPELMVQELSDKAIDLHMKYGERLPSPHSTMHIYPINGAGQRPEVLTDEARHRSARPGSARL